MAPPRIIEVRESLLADNAPVAEALRGFLAASGCFAVNVMGSPGSGKTSLILATLARLPAGVKAAVIEADLDSSVDAEAVERGGHRAVQLHTGGFCHLDARMTAEGFSALGYDLPAPCRDAGAGGARPAGTPQPDYDLVFVENVGNLICTAQVDAGAHLNLALLSLPEGDDKALKYPVMFRAADIVLVTKTDYAGFQPFDFEAFAQRVAFLNPPAEVLSLSARTGEGMESWLRLLEGRRAGKQVS